MHFKQSAPIFLAGCAAGFLFCFSAINVTGGALVIYLPVFPLLLLGLAYGSKPMPPASLIAAIIVTLFTGSSNIWFFAFVIALPAFYFTHKILLHKNVLEWYPVLRALAELSLLASGLYMCVAILASQTEPGGLQALLSRELADSLTSTDPAISHIMKFLTGEGGFFLFAATGWSFVLMLYLFAVCANKLLLTRGLALRPSLALTPHGLPLMLPGILLISGAFAFFGQGADRFNGETVFLLLILPYFLSGVALIHTLSRGKRGRPFMLGIFYGALLLLLWPALFAAGAGLCLQIAEILDRRHKIG